jgi:hypothetical protein
MTPRRKGGALSVNAYARRRGVSHTAVQQRILAGSLPTSARQIKGRWVIVDPDRADAEWDAHTRPWVSPDAEPPAAPGPGRPPPSALADATLRERRARAWAMELEIARKTRELVPAREVDLRWSALVVGARTAMLGLPSRARQRLPHLTAADLTVLDALIREALEELAQTPAGVQAS